MIKLSIMRNLILFLIVFLISNFVLADKNTIVTINGKKISKDEFEAIYKKNNTNLNDASEVKTPQEYMKMFIDFKLKVAEAENRGIDTTNAFISELKTYRDELAKIYLTDIHVTDSMVNEAYYRTANLIKTSHIFFELAPNASPGDTLIAYNKAMDVLNKYRNKEATFEELARKYSEDPVAAEVSGSLSYFGAFRMITEYENHAYSAKVGEVTMPLRTKVGYHIIRVEDIRPNPGRLNVAHIMKKFNTGLDVPEEVEIRTKAAIDSIYELLLNGADYGQLARELSDDQASSRFDGKMNFISMEFSVTDFAKAAFELKNEGDYSKPVRTPYGWHIIKRFEAEPPLTFDQLKAELTRKVKEDPLRSIYSKRKFVESKKAEYGFTANSENIKKFDDMLHEHSSDSIDCMPADSENLILFKFAGKNYTANNYYDFLINEKSKKDYILKEDLNGTYDEFVEFVVTGYEDSKLEDKYTEFRYLVQEYHDGILLFSIMETDVWNRAIEDSVGLQKFYEQNKDKYHFGEHFEGYYIKAETVEMLQKITDAIENGTTDPDEIIALVEANTRKTSIQKGRWEKGSSRYIDHLLWGTEKPRDLNPDTYKMIGEMKQDGIKTLEEAKGMYLADYQAKIEKEWIQNLRSKYPVVVNDKILKKVKSLKK
jgi:peptidyl-prolyl cis-trans isomerase SurA